MIRPFFFSFSLIVILVFATGCVRMSTGVQFLPEKFICKSDVPEGKEFQLKQRVRETLYGFNLLLIPLAKPDVRKQFAVKCANLKENEYVTNLGLHTTSQTFMHLIYLFTVPVIRMEYDIVALVDVEPPK